MADTDSIFVDSPLAAVPETQGDSATVLLRTLPYCVKIGLRGEAGDPSFVAAVESVTGLSLPVAANTVVHGLDQYRVSSLLWLGPDEWQFRVESTAGDESDADQTVIDFGQALDGLHHAVVDVSDYYCLIELQGPRIIDVLEKGTPLNLHKALKSSDQCAQTRFGSAAVLLSRDAGKDAIKIQVRASFARYLWLYLSQAALEYHD